MAVLPPLPCSCFTFGVCGLIYCAVVNLPFVMLMWAALTKSVYSQCVRTFLDHNYSGSRALAQALCTGSVHAAHATHPIRAHRLSSFARAPDSLTPSQGEAHIKTKRNDSASWVALQSLRQMWHQCHLTQAMKSTASDSNPCGRAQWISSSFP